MIDRFWLASTESNRGRNSVVNLQSEDAIDKHFDYAKTYAGYYLTVHRCYPNRTWLRSPCDYGNDSTQAKVSSRGGTNTFAPINDELAYLAAVFKIDLNPIIFAAAGASLGSHKPIPRGLNNVYAGRHRAK